MKQKYSGEADRMVLSTTFGRLSRSNIDFITVW